MMSFMNAIRLIFAVCSGLAISIAFHNGWLGLGVVFAVAALSIKKEKKNFNYKPKKSD